MNDVLVCWSGDVDGCWRPADAFVRSVWGLPGGMIQIDVTAAFPAEKWGTLGRKQSLWKVRIGGDVVLCRTCMTNEPNRLVRARVLGVVEPERVD